MAERLSPDVVLLDVDMPVMGGEEALRSMVEDPPEDSAPPKVVVTMHDEPRLVRELIGLGAVGYLVKSASIEELLCAVHAAARSPVGPNDEAVMVVPPDVYRDPEEADGLSERELEALMMVARGMNNARIARSLHLADATVQRHLASVNLTIGVSTRLEAVRMALSEEWITPVT